MPARVRRGVLLLAAGFLVTAASAQARHPVQARLVADVAGVEADRAFTLGVLLTQEPGWHTYWAFSGDAGFRSEVEWTVPQGFAVGGLQWPGPHRYQEPGDLTVFGYADEVLLMAPVQAPPAVPTQAEFVAHVSWLVCREMCIPGDTTLALSLPSRGLAASDHEELFSRYQRRLPTALTDTDPVDWEASVTAADEGARRVSIRIASPHHGEGTPDFYPLEANGDALIDAGARSVDGDGTARSHLLVTPRRGAAALDRMTGVLVFTDVDGQRQYRNAELGLQPTGIDLLGADFAIDEKALSLWVYLLLAVVGGLILNLMPCVLPVISLKAMSLVSQATQEAGRIRQLGLAFVAGIVATFLGLALAVVLIRAGGEQIGWGFQFQSPGFVLVLTSLVFVLGLSLFGVVPIRLPGTSGTFGGLAEGEGLGASFLNGVLATVLATPCTAPALGTALGFAFSQPAVTVFAIFVATGLGMATPYLLLAWRPEAIRFLPRPGPWMGRFKQAMGFLLMATVLWLLWVIGKQLGMEAVVWTGAFLLCLAIGAWILGSWVDLGTSAARRRAAWGVVVVVAGLAYYAFLRPLLTPVPPPEAAGEWEDFDVTRVERLLEDGRIVFIDFTAEWCWTCKVNERTVLADAEVQARFRALDVALIQADWTNRDAEITRLIRAFGRSGVPLYVLFPAGRPEAPIVLPEVITKSILLDRLERAVGDS